MTNINKHQANKHLADRNPTNISPIENIELTGIDADTERQAQTHTLLMHPKLWRARELAAQQQQNRSGIATGFEVLNSYLPDRGWPDAALIELLMPSAGMGELRLLMPAIRSVSHTQARWVAWINPPFIPYAPALEQLGIDTNKILLIHPRTHKDALWALERASRSGNCSLALAWLDERQLKFKDTQRLQIAARQGNTLTCLFRPPSQQASMAELRLQLHALENGILKLDILKRRGGWPVHDLSVAIAEQLPQAGRHQMQEQLALWRRIRTQVSAEQKPAQRRHESQVQQTQTNPSAPNQPSFLRLTPLH